QGANSVCRRNELFSKFEYNAVSAAKLKRLLRSNGYTFAEGKKHMIQYQAEFQREGDVSVVTFPDVGYGATQDASEAEAIEMATDFLALALGDLIKQSKDIPRSNTRRGKKVSVDYVARTSQRKGRALSRAASLGDSQGGPGSSTGNVERQYRPAL